MTNEAAAIVSGWVYEEPYAMYSMDGSRECTEELLNGDYFCVREERHGVIGFVCTGESARVPGGYDYGIYRDPRYLDVGVGMSPQWTGKGYGLDFVSQAMAFTKQTFNYSCLQLVVAAFNTRAIKVYERAGFTLTGKFTSRAGAQEADFLAMRHSADEVYKY
jgi:RimJ/RimL family protein N-acetyltransferase